MASRCPKCACSVKPANPKAKNRAKAVTFPRRVAMYLAHHLRPRLLTEIAWGDLGMPRHAMVTLMRAGIHPDWVSSREGYPRKNPISAHPGSARDPGGPSPVSTEARASSLRARATADLWMAVEMWTTWSVSVGMRAPIPL